MVNVMALVVGIVAFLAVTFVVNNFILQKEFDVVSAIVNLFTVLISLWIGFQLARMLKLPAKAPLTP